MSEIITIITLGALGGSIRGVVGIAKAYKNNKKFRGLYMTLTLLSSILVGGLAAYIVGEPIYALLVGYAGEDLLENLYKMLFVK